VRKFAFLVVLALAFGGLVALGGGGQPPAEGEPTPISWPPGLPVYDHVVIVVEENKDYKQIIGSPLAPYMNNTLRKEGANFTQMYAEEHNSQGNYFWLFSGSNQGVGFRDAMPTEENNPNYPFKTPNLGASLIAKGRSFKGYAEDLPAIGFQGEFAPVGAKHPLYARKHVPWISFANVPNGKTAETSSNLRFLDFPTDPAQFPALPTVAIVVPNLDNDMHNGKPEDSIPRGDTWLKNNLDAYYRWAKTHNSLLIVTFDESDNEQVDKTMYLGLTNPLVRPADPKDQFKRDLQNLIPTIFAGAHIKPDDYAEGNGVTHVNILRTLEAMYGLPRAGAQQPNAAGAGIRDDYIITDVFVKVK
jgi:acid phosphatase